MGGNCTRDGVVGALVVPQGWHGWCSHGGSSSRLAWLVFSFVVAPQGWHGWCSLSFAELMESLRQAEQKNWTLDQHHIANLCDSLNHFLTQTGHMPPQGGSHRPPAPARITDSCALTSGKPEPSMNQGIMQSCQRS